MRGRLKFLIAAAIAFGPFAASAETVIAPAAFGRLNAQNIPISMDGYVLSSTGTGFFVSNAGHYVTPFHVAGHCTRLAILRPERAYEARVVAANAQADISVLLSAAPHVTAEFISNAGLPEGTPFVIVRYAHLAGIGGRSSVVAHYLGGMRSGPVTIAVRAAEGVVGGNSGSPIVRMEGGVSGMVTRVAHEDNRIVLGIDSRLIAAMLQSAAVPFRWQTKKISPSLAAGGAIQFTYPVACYVKPKADGN